MRSRRCHQILVMIVVASFCFTQTPVMGQDERPAGVWESHGPQFHAEVTGILADVENPLLLHLGTRGTESNVSTGLFRSTDGGVSWEFADNEQLNDVNVMTLFKVDDIIFVSVTNFESPELAGLYRSDDDGESWVRVEGEMQDKTALSIASVGDALYAGGIKIDDIEDISDPVFGLYVSFDEGQNWETIPEMEGRIVTSLEVSETRIYAATGGELPNRGAFFGEEPDEFGVFISDHSGEVWEWTLQGTRIDALHHLNGFVYAGTRENGLFRASDDDAFWQNPSKADGQPLDFGGVPYITQVFQDSLLALTLRAEDQDDGIYTSHDGQTWDFMNTTNSPVTAFISDLHEVDPFLFMGTEGDGAVRVVDFEDGLENIEWVEAEAPLAGTHVTALAANRDGQDVYAGTLQNGLFRAPSGAPVWFPTARQATFVAMRGVEISNDRTLHAYGSGVFRSLDGGETWERSVTKIEGEVSTLIYQFDQDWFVLGVEFGDDSGIWRSRDGLNWTQSSLDSVSVTRLIIPGDTQEAREDENRVFALTNNGIYLSTDSGEDNWIHVLDANSGNVQTMLEVNGLGFWAGVRFGDAGLYFSETGEAWEQVPGELEGVTVTAIAQFQGNIFVGTDENGIFVSEDGMTGWQKLDLPYADEQGSRIDQFAVIGGNDLLLAGSGGVTGVDGDDQGLIYTGDGFEWSLVDEEDVDHVRMDDKDIRKIFVLDSVVYVATEGDGIFRSEKFDLTQWFPLNTGLTDFNTRDIFYMESTNQLVLSTLEGVFTQELDVTNPDIEYFEIAGGQGFNNFDFTNSRDVRYFIEANDGDRDVPDFMRFSEDENFEDVDWIPFDDEVSFERPNFELSEGDGQKIIYAQTRDHSWNLSDVGFRRLILDQTTPQFDQHAAPANARIGQPVTVSFSVSEENMESITFRLRRPGQAWDPRRSFFFFEDVDGGIDVEIDGGFVTSGGLDYRIIVTDAAGNSDSLRDGSLSFHSVSVNAESGEFGNSVSLPAETSAQGYRMVSAPFDLQGQPIAADVFKDLGKYGRRGKWFFYSYDGDDFWTEGDGVEMQTGSAYFMIRREGGSLTNSAASATVPTSAGVMGTIPGWRLRANDWTLIGNPYNTRIALGQLMYKSDSVKLNDEAVAGQIWLYDGNWKNPQNTPDVALNAWGGLFIWSNQADTIVFADAEDPFRPAAAKVGSKIAGMAAIQAQALQGSVLKRDEESGRRVMRINALPENTVSENQPGIERELAFDLPAVSQRRDGPKTLNNSIESPNEQKLWSDLLPGEWLVQIIATSQEQSDEMNYFGVRAEAKDGLDGNDWFDPPFVQSGVGLVFPHKDWEKPAELTADVRAVFSDGLRWDFEISGEPTHAVHVEFKHLENVPEEFHIILVDEAAKIKHDLRKEPRRAFRLPEGAASKMLTVLVGHNSFINEETNGFLGVPEVFVLSQNYPNPFNPSTRIRYSLPFGGQVTLKVFDVTGRQALILEENAERDAGYYEAVADMTRFGSGVYFYNISVEGEQSFQATKKMILVK